ncbi:hypothetical protein V4Y02_23545, partial [Escherichia coli]
DEHCPPTTTPTNPTNSTLDSSITIVPRNYGQMTDSLLKMGKGSVLELFQQRKTLSFIDISLGIT